MASVSARLSPCLLATARNEAATRSKSAFTCTLIRSAHTTWLAVPDKVVSFALGAKAAAPPSSSHASMPLVVARFMFFLWTEFRFVHEPRFFELGLRRLVFVRDARSIPLRRFQRVQPFCFQDGGACRYFQLYENADQAETRTVGGTNQIVTVLRILPARQYFLLIVERTMRHLGWGAELGC